MNLEYRHTPIKCRATGATFAHTSYCRSDDDAEAFARLTFNPAVFAIGGEPGSDEGRGTRDKAVGSPLTNSSPITIQTTLF